MNSHKIWLSSLSWAQNLGRLKRYVTIGVLKDPSNGVGVTVVRTLNIFVRTYVDRDLPQRACALTYNTVLAFVPVLAMLFAIGRGFGLQELIKSQLIASFPTHREAMETAINYVDNYLDQSSQGLFIGIGLLFLLWTLISLLRNVEESFNKIWGVNRGRSVLRQFTDYTALMLILPVLMVCSAGISIFLSNTVQSMLGYQVLKPIWHHLLDVVPWLIAWLVFLVAFLFIPRVKVKFRYAAITAAVSTIAYELLQWLFVTGQIYVSKYNAIYGSFAFVLLLLVWLQLTWQIALSGVALTHALQTRKPVETGSVKDEVDEQLDSIIDQIEQIRTKIHSAEK